MPTIKDPRITTIIFLQATSLVLLLIGGVLLYDTLRVPKDSVSQNTSQSLTVSAPPSVFPVSNGVVTDTAPYLFNASGTLMMIDEKTWYLFYYTDANVQQVMRLVFSPQSMCINQQGQPIVCVSDGKIVNGIHVHISGNKNGDVVSVGMLTMLP